MQFSVLKVAMDIWNGNGMRRVGSNFTVLEYLFAAIKTRNDNIFYRNNENMWRWLNGSNYGVFSLYIRHHEMALIDRGGRFNRPFHVIILQSWWEIVKFISNKNRCVNAATLFFTFLSQPSFPMASAPICNNHSWFYNLQTNIIFVFYSIFGS